jgi:hypothetical protein
VKARHPGISSMNGKWLSATVIALLVALALPGCKDFPGADGRYAHGYGYLYKADGGSWAP